jgi:hypothetical protein
VYERTPPDNRVEEKHMTNASAAQGWYLDPYGRHQDRYFSQGQPTKLVRDGEVESVDPPPAEPLPAGELVSVERPGAQDGSDLLRTDRPSGTYDPGQAINEAFGMAW